MMKRFSTFGLAAAFAVVAMALPFSAAADWPQFRGAEREGLSSETGLLKSWPASGPKELWRVPLGEGFSGISIADGRAVTLFAQGRDTFAAAFSVKDGAPLWKTRLDEKWDDRFGNGPRATPTIHGDKIYVVSGRGQLAALQAGSGKIIWQKDLAAAYKAKPPTWGVSSSPLVEGDLLIVNAGGPKGASVVAFDKETGAEAWKNLSDKPGYSAPVAVTIEGVRQVLIFTGDALVSVAPQSGKELWRQGWSTSYDVNAATPILVGTDRVFVSSGYDVGAAVYRIAKAGERWKVEQVWKNRQLKNKFSSSVLHDGHLYGFDEGTLKSVDVATGETRWRGRGFAHGSLIYADGMLIVMGERGQLALVEATPEAYRLISEFEMFAGKTWTMPALADGILFVRDEKELVALRVAG